MYQTSPNSAISTFFFPPVIHKKRVLKVKEWLKFKDQESRGIIVLDGRNNTVVGVSSRHYTPYIPVSNEKVASVIRGVIDYGYKTI